MFDNITLLAFYLAIWVKSILEGAPIVYI